MRASFVLAHGHVLKGCIGPFGYHSTQGNYQEGDKDVYRSVPLLSPLIWNLDLHKKVIGSLCLKVFSMIGILLIVGQIELH